MVNKKVIWNVQIIIAIVKQIGGKFILFKYPNIFIDDIENTYKEKAFEVPESSS